MLTNERPAPPQPTPPVEARSLRRRLRIESSASHERLDARFEGMADEARPEAYGRFLQVNEACHRAIEPILAASPVAEAAPGFRLTRRTPALSADLGAMGLPPLRAPAFPLAEPDKAEAVGIVYVIEGSRLGAGYILSKIRGRPLGDAWRTAGFAYLEGPDEPHALRSFLAEASEALGEADVGRAVAAADATFRYFLEVEALSRRGDGL